MPERRREEVEVRTKKGGGELEGTRGRVSSGSPLRVSPAVSLEVPDRSVRM